MPLEALRAIHSINAQARETLREEWQSPSYKGFMVRDRQGRHNLAGLDGETLLGTALTARRLAFAAARANLGRGGGSGRDGRGR
jgi:hypothetical protein